MRSRRPLLTPLAQLAVLLLAAVCAAGAPADEPTGLREEVVFSEYTPLAANAELLRRMLSPLAAAQVQVTLAQSHEKLIEQSVDLAAEKFVLYVPPQAPPHGYGLLVFVPPWEEARLPPGWAQVLDRAGVIYVSAAHSGNEANVIARREPLALLAAYNVLKRYPVDPSRLYVGGFSGGSRIALRLALGYPDLFSGAFLNAGSDPLGTLVPPIPQNPLWQRFQESSQLALVTGERDAVHLSMDTESLQSLRQWCVFGVEATETPGAAHQLASPSALSGALQVLGRHREPPQAKLAACRADLERTLDAQLKEVGSLLDSGQRDAAQKLLLEIDRRFAGLAAPRSLALWAALH
jgi:dienelactone hydrolase